MATTIETIDLGNLVAKTSLQGLWHSHKSRLQRAGFGVVYNNYNCWKVFEGRRREDNVVG
jgi:hypothetical protein